MPRYFYERISGLTRIVQVLLGLSILVSLFGIWSAFSQIRMMKNGEDAGTRRLAIYSNRKKLYGLEAYEFDFQFLLKISLRK